jgi:hypothetical protein
MISASSRRPRSTCPSSISRSARAIGPSRTPELSLVPVPPSSPYFLNHDSLAEDEFINAGLGTGFALTPELTAFAIYMEGLEGRNGHKMNQGLTIGFSYGFRPRAEAVGVAEASE